MARLPKTVRDQVRSETRQRLLEAAAAEFADQGYVGANINRISQTAGFAKGTIYNYFPSKRVLMLALVDEIAAAHTDSILQEVETQAVPSRRLERFFRAGFAFVEQHPTQAQVIINTLYGPDAEFKGHVYQAYKRLFAMVIRDILQTGIARGDFRPVDADLTTALIMTIYLGACSQVYDEGKIWLDPEQVIRFILDGIRPREPLLESEA